MILSYVFQASILSRIKTISDQKDLKLSKLLAFIYPAYNDDKFPPATANFNYILRPSKAIDGTVETLYPVRLLGLLWLWSFRGVEILSKNLTHYAPNLIASEIFERKVV